MKIRMGIKDLTCKAFIGCLDQEHQEPQDINVKVECVYDMSEVIKGRHETGCGIHLAKAIDYCAVKKVCLQTIEAPTSLLEILAYELQENLKKAFPQIEFLKVDLEKPHAFRGKDYPFVSLTWEK